MSEVQLYHGDCLDVLPALPENSVDTCITDPPYGLEFMGKDWDSGIPSVAFWREVLRVLKPGASLMAFGGTRTWHRLAVAIEDAGFEIRDTVMWVYGSGFPKSMSVSKAIDREAGMEREVIGLSPNDRPNSKVASGMGFDRALDKGQGHKAITITAPATPEAQLWDGWGTALKPAWEPIIVAMKPREGTYAQNALKWGVAGLWIDGGRVPTNGENVQAQSGHRGQPFGVREHKFAPRQYTTKGRWPANVIHDGSEEVLREFPESKGQAGDVRGTEPSRTGGSGTNCYGEYGRIPAAKRNDSGSAARFFYCAKASRKERDAGLEDFQETTVGDGRKKPIDNAYQRGKTGRKNTHPAVKPLALMRYLCRLTKTPTGGVVLDPFMGSGTTGMAAVLEGRGFIGIEIEKEYFDVAEKRIGQAQMQPRLPMEGL